MENKINIAELLKDSPKGMELYSPIFGKVYLDKIRPHLAIVVTTDKYKEEFLYDGRYGMNGECMLFPSKGKTTWEGFIPPCKFKDGDILYINCTDEDEDDNNQYEYIFIFNKIDNNKIYSYCHYYMSNNRFYPKVEYLSDNTYPIRFATKEEKQKLFDAIKAKGYKWNAEAKTLDKLEQPWTIQYAKDGDVLAAHECLVLFKKLDGLNIKCYCTYHFMGHQSFYVDILQNKDAFHPATKEQRDLLFQKMKEAGYKWNEETKMLEKLVPNKFDITTLKPFDRVLVRGDVGQKWTHDFFGFMDKDKGYPFVCVGALCNSMHPLRRQ